MVQPSEMCMRRELDPVPPLILLMLECPILRVGDLLFQSNQIRAIQELVGSVKVSGLKT